MLEAYGSYVIAHFVLVVGNLVAKTFSVTKCNLNEIGFAPNFVANNQIMILSCKIYQKFITN